MMQTDQTRYAETAFRIETPQGLSAGNLSFAWNPDTDVLTVHKLLAWLLGMRGPIALGYDTIANARIVAAVADDPKTGFAARSFLVIARLVPKKNLELAIRAYAAYRASAGGQLRPMRICGSGEEEVGLRALVTELGLEEHVQFLGFRQQEEIAAELANALCLLLPSIEEQWGLVVNEATAAGLPVLVSDVVGARESLVRSFVNGFVLEPDNPEGWGAAMAAISEDQMVWERLSAGSRAIAVHGDVSRFARCVSALVGIGPTAEAFGD